MNYTIRRWITRYWWPARIRQLDSERATWKRWCQKAEKRAVKAEIALNAQKANERICIYPHSESSELLELAWGLIANSYSGDWDLATEASGWKGAAERWRDRYHGLHDAAAHIDNDDLPIVLYRKKELCTKKRICTWQHATAEWEGDTWHFEEVGRPRGA